MIRAWVAVIVLLFWHIYRLSMAVRVLTSRDIGWRERVACRRVLFACPATIPNPQPWEKNLVFNRAERAISAVTILVVIWALFSACAHPIYPRTSGSHAQLSTQDTNIRCVVWSNHPGVGQLITSLLLASGTPVVERSRLDAVFAEQRLILSHAKDEDVLRVGRLVGATQVIFAEVRGVEPRRSWEPPMAASVTVRAVAVESAEVRWAGMAAYSEPANEPEQSVLNLTKWAIARAICTGIWEEPSDERKGGCQEQSHLATQKAAISQDRSIWMELRKMERR